MSYTTDEEAVLNYFFTNLDKPVFLARNFHPEVWALMQARYSRSSKGMRESFLELLHEDEENFQQLSTFIKGSKAGAQMDHAINKAITFMDKWVLGYGHASVAEGAIVGIGIEGVSILATKIIEDNRLASYIEKSTRYVSFGRDSFLIPAALKESSYGGEVERYIDELFQSYKDFHDPVLAYVKKVVPLQEGMNEKAWERSCGARRFDAIRYLLPTCTKTSLGWTLNARQLAHAISKMLSYPLEEAREIGEMIRAEGKKVLPSLLKYAEKNEYFSGTEQKMRITAEIYQQPRSTDAVVLVEASSDADNRLIASILYRYSSIPYDDLKEHVKQLTVSEKREILDEYTKKRGTFDSLLREFEHVTVTFDVLMDYGAFRDIQRHRICTMTHQLLDSSNGYDIPDDILKASLDVRSTYVKLMEKGEILHKKLSAIDPYAAQYILPLAYKKRTLITMNLREAFHFIKIRSTPQGHISYRSIAKQMFDLLRERHPLITACFICEMKDDELGRLAQETKYKERAGKL